MGRITRTRDTPGGARQLGTSSGLRHPNQSLQVQLFQILESELLEKLPAVGLGGKVDQVEQALFRPGQESHLVCSYLNL